MSLFTFILDLAALQGYALFQVIDSKNKMEFVDFKRSLCEAMVMPHRRCMLRAVPTTNPTPIQIPEHVIGGISDADGHMLIENIGKAGIHCHFCLMSGEKRKTIYGCTKCGRGFHVNCYTAYHFQGALKSDASAIASMILRLEGSKIRGINKRSKYVGDISSMKLLR